jgi:hypothetical protein
MSGLQQIYCVPWNHSWIHIYEARYREQATEFFEEASALNIDAAIVDLKKQILQWYVQLDGVCEHPLV